MLSRNMVPDFLTNNLGATSVLVFASTFLFLHWFYREPSRFPKSPRGWPLVGNLGIYFGKEQPFEKFVRISKQYGDVFSFTLLGKSVVVLNGWNVIKDALVNKGNYFNNRPIFGSKRQSERGIIFQNGAHWKILRRFAISTLRDLGVGKATLESRIQEEAEYLVQEFEKQGGKPFYVKNHFTKAVANIVCSVVFGNRFEYDDAVFVNILEQLDYFFSNTGLQMLAKRLKFFRYLGGSKVTKMLNANEEIRAFIQSKVAEHRQTFDPDNVRDFIDIYIESEQAKREDDETPVTEENMYQVILDLFGAGTETTSTAMQWAILYMVNYPDVQTRCREEIYQVVGKDRLPKWADRKSLPYTEATCMEVLRLGNVAPLAVPHCTSEDITFHGYFIPRDTTILVNLWSVNMDEALWPQPRVMKPERWISADGSLIAHEAFVPFSIGRRVCAGENLARMELFLYFSALIQRFNFVPVDADSPPAIEGKLGMTYVPLPYDVIAMPT